ncbi:MAG: hypothetical protein HYX67_04690 [Candidatus Melainabacteria bacterium]|nr:hypothetical protein [Candidatus Melainabacteria bacterium]
MTKININFSLPPIPSSMQMDSVSRAQNPVIRDSIRSQANSGEGVCKAITDFFMRIWNAIKSCFSRPVQPTPVTTTTPTAKTSGARNIVAFYQGREANNNGVTLEQTLSWDDNTLESRHDYIQWLFPTDAPSGSNLTAPILDPATIEIFRNDVNLRRQVFRSFQRMLSFYGLQYRSILSFSDEIVRARNFNARAAVWLTPADHNYHNFLRITRIIHSLNILEFRGYSESFLTIMVDIARNEGRAVVTPNTLAHWQNASRS